jgi:hypothetical protein
MSSVSEALSVVSQQFTVQYKGKIGSNSGNGIHRTPSVEDGVIARFAES